MIRESEDFDDFGHETGIIRSTRNAGQAALPGPKNRVAATTCSATYDAQVWSAPCHWTAPCQAFCRGMNGSLQVCSIQVTVCRLAFA